MTTRNPYNAGDGPIGTEGRLVQSGVEWGTHVRVEPDGLGEGDPAVVVAGRRYDPEDMWDPDAILGQVEVVHRPFGARSLAGLIWDAADEARLPIAAELANRLRELARIVARYGKHARAVGAPAGGGSGGAEELAAGLESWAARIRQWDSGKTSRPEP